MDGSSFLFNEVNFHCRLVQFTSAFARRGRTISGLERFGQGINFSNFLFNNRILLNFSGYLVKVFIPNYNCVKTGQGKQVDQTPQFLGQRMFVSPHIENTRVTLLKFEFYPIHKLFIRQVGTCDRAEQNWFLKIPLHKSNRRLKLTLINEFDILDIIIAKLYLNSRLWVGPSVTGRLIEDKQLLKGETGRTYLKSWETSIERQKLRVSRSYMGSLPVFILARYL